MRVIDCRILGMPSLAFLAKNPREHVTNHYAVLEKMLSTFLPVAKERLMDEYPDLLCLEYDEANQEESSDQHGAGERNDQYDEGENNGQEKGRLITIPVSKCKGGKKDGFDVYAEKYFASRVIKTEAYAEAYCCFDINARISATGDFPILE